jgi:signal transduction histidine kinase/CheY-like chemotaxis protein
MTVRSRAVWTFACAAFVVSLAVYATVTLFFGERLSLQQRLLHQSPHAEIFARLSRPSSSEAVQTIRIYNSTGQDLGELTFTEGVAVTADLPRAALQEASRVSFEDRTTIALIATLIGATIFILSVVTVQRLFLTPISQLSSLIRKMSAANNLSLRVPHLNSGFLEGITDSVNNMLDTTEHSYYEMLNARYEAERANKGKSLFIAKVSHELRTPIHSITGMLRILLKQEQAAGKRQYIQMAKDSADALLYTINEVLDFSKMQSGSLSLEREQFNLIQVVRETIESLIPRFEEKPEVAFCWDVHPGVAESVIGDAARIKNVLVNLLGNGFKFTEKGHVILDVRPIPITTPSKTGVRFTVSDSGIGIALDKLDHIFDPFTTADEKTARLYSGTGLGLAIVKQIAEQTGGSVSVTSTPGEGSTFTVDIPFDINDQKVDLNAQVNASGKRVAILAEDGPREFVVTEGFARLGCEVARFRFDNSEELAILQQSLQAFDLLHIIKSSDVLMDELSPLLRAASQHQIPVVLSVLSSELASTGALMRSDIFFETLQPTSALDVLLIAAGKLMPNTSIISREEHQEKSAHKLKILVADDAKTNRIILKMLLEEAGHSVEVVENGKQLLEKITYRSDASPSTDFPYDLVLTDIQMPVMDGLTATQNFRELEKKSEMSRKLPIVAVTSYALPEECTKMLASGIDHIITKPISPQRLSRLLSQISSESEEQLLHTADAQADRDTIEELSRIAENVAERVTSLTEEIKRVSPISTELGINVEDLYDRSGNSIRRTGLILSGFLESYQEPLQELEQTTAPPADPIVLRRTVHSLKGLLLDAGACSAAELASKLEKQIVDSPTTVTRESIEALGDVIRSTVLIVKELVQAIPSLEVFSALPPIDDELTLH